MVAKSPRRSPLIFFAGLAVFALVALIVSLPPAPRHVPLTAALDPLVVKGAIHIHTTRSDGGGTIDEVAAAAARAGLQFIVITDHGDGRGLLPPSYRSGVLCIDGAEISTDDGHLVAIGFREPEYRLAGAGGDVIEDLHRLGGVAFVSHPESPKRELAWRDWDAPFDGIEWLNGDSEWRDESALGLGRLALSYLIRPAASIASGFDRPVTALERFDAVSARRALVAIAGHDAHARIAADGEGERGWGASLPVPSYAAMFRAFAVRAVLDAPLAPNPADAAAAVIRAIRHGRVFTAIDGMAAPARISFVARSGSASAGIGERLIPAGGIEFEIRADAPEGSTLVLLHEGRAVASGRPPALTHQREPTPGAYRAEVRMPGTPGNPPVPWILTSTIHVGIPSAPLPSVAPVSTGEVPLSLPADLALWRIEHGPGSDGRAVAAGTDEVVFTYRIGSDGAASPYAALVRPIELRPGARALAFRGRADRPMRVSVQVRLPGAEGGLRWRYSVFLDERDREIHVPLSAMRPVNRAASSRGVEGADALLFVADTVNADPGASGWISIAALRLVY